MADKCITVLVVTDQDSYDIPILASYDEEKLLEAHDKWRQEQQGNPYYRQNYHTFRVRLVE